MCMNHKLAHKKKVYPSTIHEMIYPQPSKTLVSSPERKCFY